MNVRIGGNMTELPVDDETLKQWIEDLDEKKARIRAQSKQVATYIESNDEFYNWFCEVEGFHIREERFWDDCERGDSKELFEWVRWAFHLGYEAGKQRGTD
jgi:hypothetical protein